MKPNARILTVAAALVAGLACLASAAVANDPKAAAKPAAAPSPAPVAKIPPCAANPNGLSVSRVVEIDTTGGPGFGFEHYKAYDFLQNKEVVLTFDDGPWPGTTKAVLDALASHCTKGTFFIIGKNALDYPDILKQVVAGGHTIGTHTFLHKDLAKMPADKAKEEIEKGISATKLAAGVPPAAFFRYPFLKDSAESVAYLGSRNVAMFSTDIDSFDFKFNRNPDLVVKTVMDKLEKKGKGIILMHDFHKSTATSLPKLLGELKDKGYKVVHIKSKSDVATLADYDAEVAKGTKGLITGTGTGQPASSVVRTIAGDGQPQ
ncbi:MAG: polysaccharide deacetylase family protein [Hyphomicrobiaceae bacterium]|nr:polysaccharide deacetylase family protein [Hyphomicrobiaceae bacterium]